MASRGIKASGGTDFVTGYVISADEMNTDLNAAFTGINNLVVSDANVVGGANIDPSKVGDFADTDGVYQTNAAPATRGHSNNGVDGGGLLFSTLTTSKPLTLEEELSRGRYFWKAGYAGIVDNTTGLPVQDQWYAPVEKGVILLSPGMILPFFGTTAPSGWIKLDDGSIGSGLSAATNRANYDTRELFRMLWRMFVDADCPVSGGRGADPDTDFNANKTIRLPLMAGRLPGVSGTPVASNTIDTIAGIVNAGSSSTVFTLYQDQAYLTDNILNGYTVTITSGALSGQSAVVSAYVAATQTVTVGAGLGGTPAANVTFTMTRAVATRAHGAKLGKTDIIPTGSLSASSTGGARERLSGFSPSTASTTANIHEMTNYPPTFFLNWICKL